MSALVILDCQPKEPGSGAQQGGAHVHALHGTASSTRLAGRAKSYIWFLGNSQGTSGHAYNKQNTPLLGTS